MDLRLMITNSFSLKHMEEFNCCSLLWIWVLIIHQTKDTFQEFRTMEQDVYWKQDWGFRVIQGLPSNFYCSTTVMAKSKKELKVKEESKINKQTNKNTSLKLGIQKIKIMASDIIITNNDQPRQHIKKQRHYFANKGPSSQCYGFSSGHVWMWELNYKESWAPKNWCFWTVVLEKTLESPLNCKGFQAVHPKGNQSWIFIGRIDDEADTSILWPFDVKKWLLWKDPDAGKDWRWEEKGMGMTEDEMVRWHHRPNGHEFE